MLVLFGCVLTVLAVGRHSGQFDQSTVERTPGGNRVKAVGRVLPSALRRKTSKCPRPSKDGGRAAESERSSPKWAVKTAILYSA